jgi:hypothetical protein
MYTAKINCSRWRGVSGVLNSYKITFDNWRNSGQSCYMAIPAETKIKILDEMFKRLAGGESLSAICRDSHMPDKHTFYAWMDKDTNILTRYEAATSKRAEHIFDEIIEISDNKKKIDDDGYTIHNSNEAIQRDRLRVEARKWVLGKMAPKKYGEAAQIRLADADGNKLVEGMSDADIINAIRTTASSRITSTVSDTGITD